MSDFDRLSEENKDIIRNNLPRLMTDFIHKTYAEYGYKKETTEKHAVKALLKKMRLERQYDRYTDKQLKKMINVGMKILNDKKRDEVIAEQNRMLNSTEHIVEVDVDFA